MTSRTLFVPVIGPPLVSRWVLVAGLLTLLVPLGGCLKFSVDYPLPAHRPGLTRFVSLRIIDGRRIENEEARPVLGFMRSLNSSYYSFPIRERRVDAATVLVRNATIDALGRAGIGVREDAPQRLDVQLRKFWMDGYVGHIATIEADCTLSDAHGVSLWQSPIMSRRSGVVVWSTKSEATELLRIALVEFAAQAVHQFNSNDFQHNLSR